MVDDSDFRSALGETGARDIEYDTTMAPSPVTTTTTTTAAPGPVRSEPMPMRTTEVLHEEEVVDRPVERPGFSVAAGFFGWAVAMWFTLVFTGIVLAFLGNAAYNNALVTSNSIAFSQTTINNLTVTGAVAGIISLFLAFFLGGFAAGRIGRLGGAWHGAAVVGWTALFAILGAVLGYYATSTANVGAYLNAYAIDWNAITTTTIVTLAVMVVVMLLGAILGGVLGENIVAREVGVERRTHVTRGWRGRPRV